MKEKINMAKDLGLIGLWRKERDEVVKTLDIKKFKEFYRKWKLKGFYNIPLPDDAVIEISLHKMLYNINSATDEEKSKAKEWLESRGYSTEM